MAASELSIKENGNKPEDWLLYIRKIKRDSSNYAHVLSLYAKAASVISPDANRKNISYARLLVDYAKMQGVTCAEDARDIFRVARCNVKRFAIVYVGWAQLELSQGNHEKCKSHLHKGKLVGAEPSDLLNQALFSCEQGNNRLLDDEMEEMAFTGVVTMHEPGRNPLIPTLLTEDELTTEKIIKGEDIADKSHKQMGDSSLESDENVRSSTKSNSGVILFKLPTTLNGHSVACKKLSHSTSSSGEDTDTAPLHHICRPTGSMSTNKTKPTADSQQIGSSSLQKSMNMSVRKSNVRRGLRSNPMLLGPPLRGRPVLEDDEEENAGDEGKKDDDMDGIKLLDQNGDTSHPVVGGVNGNSMKEPKDYLPTFTDGHPEKSLEIEQYKSHINSAIDSRSVPSHDPIKSFGREINHQFKPQELSKFQQNSAEMKSIETVIETRGTSGPAGPDNYNYKPSTRGIVTPQYPSVSNHPNQNGFVAGPHYANGNKISQVQQEHAFPGTAFPGTAFPGTAFPGTAFPGTAFPGTAFPGTAFSGTVHVPVNQVLQPQHLPVYVPSSTVNTRSILVSGTSYQIYGTIGRGGSSKVYSAFDGKNLCALKYVSLEDADESIVQSYINEIMMLKRLQGSDHIVKLYDWEQKKDENSIILVLEYGSIDLAAYLHKNRSTLTQWELRSLWEQMLQAVNVIHNEGIIHSDLKPANFLFIKGKLKLIDFGIANSIQADQTSIARETKVGTLNFMSPEAFQDIYTQVNPSTGRSKTCTKIGRPSDVWSLGCILYNMVYGRTPFQLITNQLMKLQCIMDENYVIEFPKINNLFLLDVLKGCLIRNPRKRYTIPQLLKHQLFNPDGLTAGLAKEMMSRFVMEMAKAQVISPESFPVAKKIIQELLQLGNKTEVSPPSANVQPAPSHPTGQRHPLRSLSTQELPRTHSSSKQSSKPADPYFNKENADLQFS